MWVIVQQFDGVEPDVYGPFETKEAARAWAIDRNEAGGFSCYDSFDVVEVRHV